MTKHRFIGILIVVLMMVAFIGSLLVQGQDDNTVDPRYVGSVQAPPFPPDVDWLNVDAPLTLDGLRGKVVLLDFWTYGCINCIHMIPVLRDLGERFADELVILSVHSAKFDNEGQTDNLEQIVRRYEIEHPVINDSEFTVWRSYAINAWPTFVIIDPRGNVIAAQSGEVPFDAFERYLASLIEYYDANPDIAEINRTPLDVTLEGAGDPGTPLAFPGKVLADADSNRLFIADTNHHRIVIADLTTYEIVEIIGTGERGYADGDYDAAQFDQPQGMELVGDTLYVADVNNHAIREIDLNNGTVTTLAGTGTMGRGIVAFDAYFDDARSFDMRSPWDVALGDDDLLYIAMAGTHQIWQIHLETGRLQPAIGNGREAQISTTLADSELAQPSGLHWHDGLLYFADSESSTVRVADIPEDTVTVIAGTTANNLFEYGDVDGVAGESLLQHALGVTANTDGSQVYIADTYNSKIKVYDTQTGIIETLTGQGGLGGYRDGALVDATFDEPGGLDYADGKLYIADTNNHAIRVLDLAEGTVQTISFPNVEALVLERRAVTVLGGNSAEGVQVTLEPQTVAIGEAELMLTFTLPEGYKLNDLADSTLDLSSEGDLIAIDDTTVAIASTDFSVPITLTDTGETTLSLTIALFYCEEDTVCLIDDVQIDAPLVITDDATNRIIAIQREVVLPDFLRGE